MARERVMRTLALSIGWPSRKPSGFAPISIPVRNVGFALHEGCPAKGSLRDDELLANIKFHFVRVSDTRAPTHASISSFSQATQRGPSLTGAGKRPAVIQL